MRRRLRTICSGLALAALTIIVPRAQSNGIRGFPADAVSAERQREEPAEKGSGSYLFI